MTSDELKSVVDTVMTELRQNTTSIADLPEKTIASSDACIELDSGHKLKIKNLLQGTQTKIDVSDDFSLTQYGRLQLSDKAKRQNLIDRWNTAWKFNKQVFGQYNEQTGNFEGNGVTDITDEQAQRILEVGTIRLSDANQCYYEYNLPTILPVVGGTLCNLYRALSCVRVDVVRIVNYYIVNNGQNADTYPMKTSNTRDFNLYGVVKEYKGVLDVSSEASSNTLHFNNGTFTGTLEKLWVKNIFKNINMSNAKSFSIECLEFMIDNAANTSAITITLHKNVYDKLTAALIDKAHGKNITLASA